MVSFKLSSAALCILPFLVAAMPQDSSGSSGTSSNARIHLFSEPNFSGTEQLPEQGACSDLDFDLAHHIGSARVQPGFYCEIFEHQGCFGRSRCRITRDQQNLLSSRNDCNVHVGYDAVAVYCDEYTMLG